MLLFDDKKTATLAYYCTDNPMTALPYWDNPFTGEHCKTLIFKDNIRTDQDLRLAMHEFQKFLEKIYGQNFVHSRNKSTLAVSKQTQP
jgi:hypothetical protein